MKKKLGEILVELGTIGWDQLRKALEEGKGTGELLGDVLIRLGWIGEEQLNIALAVQSGVQLVDTRFVKAEPEVLSLVPAELARSSLLLPYVREGDLLKVAMANPYDVLARDRLQQSTGLRIEPLIASREWLIKAIDFFYKTAVTLDEEVATLISKSRDRGSLGEEDEALNSRLVELFIAKGVIIGASDVHFEPDEKVLRVYYRVDGSMHQEYLMPRHLHGGVITRIKVLSEIPIGDPNVPHDGRMIFHTGIQRIAIRVSTFPTQYGEAGVLRLLQRAEGVGEMEALGLSGEARERFRRAIHRPYGLILTTGPTGSGKTTTLYTVLMEINSPTNNVITIEDPIEYVIPTIRQAPVNPKAGFTFATALRSALRQDPDIIMVGEIRDQETAALALRAAITGHLVLSTLHTNDAPSAIHRLLDLGIAPTILASGLVLVMAQRLVRKLCPKCKEPKTPEERERHVLRMHGFDENAAFYGPKGCSECRWSGYKGRTGIYEVLEMSPEIEELTVELAPRSRILTKALEQGMRPLIVDGLEKASKGITSLEEVLRVAV